MDSSDHQDPKDALYPPCDDEMPDEMFDDELAATIQYWDSRHEDYAYAIEAMLQDPMMSEAFSEYGFDQSLGPPDENKITNEEGTSDSAMEAEPAREQISIKLERWEFDTDLNPTHRDVSEVLSPMQQPAETGAAADTTRKVGELGGLNERN